MPSCYYISRLFLFFRSFTVFPFTVFTLGRSKKHLFGYLHASKVLV